MKSFNATKPWKTSLGESVVITKRHVEVGGRIWSRTDTFEELKEMIDLNLTISNCQKRSLAFYATRAGIVWRDTVVLRWMDAEMLLDQLKALEEK